VISHLWSLTVLSKRLSNWLVNFLIADLNEAAARRTLRVYSLIRRWSLEGLTVVRYDDVNMDSDVSSISMSINNGLLTQLEEPDKQS
jgi:hypothetical protein